MFIGYQSLRRDDDDRSAVTSSAETGAISGVLKLSPPPLYNDNSTGIDGDGEYDHPNDPPSRSEPGDPDDQGGAEVDGAEIQVPPDDAGGAPGDPSRDDARLDIPALDVQMRDKNTIDHVHQLPRLIKLGLDFLCILGLVFPTKIKHYPLNVGLLSR
ncbi:hypothetical protein RSAG8_07196, partial [Rhizoctonia solani AG-8 WAC10335]